MRGSSVSRRARRAVFGALGAVLLTAPAVVAESGYSTPPTVLRERPASTSLQVADVATAGDDVAVVWSERTAGDEVVRFRSSTDGGRTFRASRLVEDRDGAWASADICAGFAWVAHSFRLAGDPEGMDGVILDGFPLVGSGIVGELLVESGTVSVNDTDLACVGRRRHAVAWLDSDFKSTATAYLRFVPVLASEKGERPPDVNRSFPADAFGSLAVAGTGNRAWLAWTSAAARIKIRTFHVGRGPDFPVTDGATLTLPDIGDLSGAIALAAHEQRVLIAYVLNGDTYARISTDGGSSFGPRRKLLDGVFGGDLFTNPLSADVRGTRAVVHASELGGFKDLDATAYRFRSSDDGATWTGVRRYSDGDRLGAFTVEGGQPKLVEAWDQWASTADPQRIRFHRKL
jgi:hypothetical protein